MRLRILDSGHGFGTKGFFALIRTVSRQPVLDVIKGQSGRLLRRPDGGSHARCDARTFYLVGR